MRLFKIKIEYEDEIEANDEDEAYSKFYENANSGNNDLPSLLDENITIKEVCPHCKTELESKMIDIDGTNLEEHTVCENCGYDYPALL